MNKNCVIYHYGYGNEWNFYKPYFKNIENYDLFITVYYKKNTDEYMQCIHNVTEINMNAMIINVENKGLDGGPFLIALHKINKMGLKYDYIIKLHSKSPYNYGPEWRQQLIDSIIGSKYILEKNLYLLKENKNIGMIGSSEWLIEEPLKNDIEQLFIDLFEETSNEPNYKFIGGTMFIARFNIFDNIISKNDNIIKYISKYTSGVSYDENNELIEKEAHWLERIFGKIVENAGYEIIGV